jgi:hypothetical protein
MKRRDENKRKRNIEKRKEKREVRNGVMLQGIC